MQKQERIHFHILQVIKNWTVGRPRNEARGRERTRVGCGRGREGGGMEGKDGVKRWRRMMKGREDRDERGVCLTNLVYSCILLCTTC